MTSLAHQSGSPRRKPWLWPPFSASLAITLVVRPIGTLVVDALGEGSGLVRRLLAADPDAEIDIRDFSYPGPRPQSKETAILMLADSVESAARVLPDPSPEAIRDLVDRIVRGKIDLGQLDEAPITLAELSTIKEKFASVLSGMYHQRIDYPPAREEPEPEDSAERAEAGVP